MLQQLIDKTLGKSWTVTGPDAGECTAIAHQWSVDLGLPIIYGNAKDTWENAGAEYTKTQEGLPGDIAVLGEMPGNPDGHTGVVTEVFSGGYKMLNQNDPYHTKTNIKTYNRNYLKGFIRPNNYKGELMYPKEGDLKNIYAAKGWPGHPPNANDIAYWCNGTGNARWGNDRDVWTDLVVNVATWQQQQDAAGKPTDYEPVPYPVFKKK